jgi:serine protease Do
MNMISTKRYWWWSAASLVGAVALVASALAFADKMESNTAAKGVTLNLPVAETPVARDSLPRGSYASIVKKVAPAVVRIETTTTQTNSSAQEWFGFNDPLWKRFFGDQFGQVMPQPPSGPFHEYGVGSGVIVTKDGYILTNNHVVDNANEVKVILADGRKFTAKVVGRDPKADIAVVKIAAEDLPVIGMADSDKVEAGDVALAVGNPFGVGETVTSGIISATGRANVGLNDYEDFLQTDAAINPGNSGGALVDIDGRLIGINTAILSHSGGSQGVGLAIPSNLARTIMESLVKYGKVTRGYLGVMIQNVTPTSPGNKPFNKAQPTGSQDFMLVFNSPENFVRFKCDIHAWMFAYVSVFDHPWFAVSSQDGQYRIHNVPPGRYTVVAEHRKSGTLQQNVEVRDHDVKLDFTFPAKGGR